MTDQVSSTASGAYGPRKHTMQFSGQQEGEVVKYFIRKHWIVELPIVSKMIITGLIYAALIFFLQINPFNLNQDIIWISLAAASLLLAVYYFRRLVEWMDQILDVFILTDKRLLSFEQEGLFHRISKEMDIRQIEDVQSEQLNWIDNLLRIGSLRIANKSENIVFDIRNIYDPHRTKRLIMDSRDQGVAQEEASRRQEEVQKVIDQAKEAIRQAATPQEQIHDEIKVENPVRQIEVPDPDA